MSTFKRGAVLVTHPTVIYLTGQALPVLCNTTVLHNTGNEVGR